MFEKLLFARRDPQAPLTDEQLESLQKQLFSGELSEVMAIVLLSQQVYRGDRRAVDTTMAYLSALGFVGAPFLRLAAEFYLSTRDYAEAHRYALTLCYEFDRYGPALRRLAIIDGLRGDYVRSLAHIDEYFEYDPGEDLELRAYQIEYLFRSGAFTAAAESSERWGLHSDLAAFIRGRGAGRGSGPGHQRFSWHGAPTRSGQIEEKTDTHQVRRTLSEVLKQPLMLVIDDLGALDRAINEGTYVRGARTLGPPEGWVRPAAFEGTLTGSSLDFALWAWVHLCRLGMPARLTVGGLYADASNHAWVTFHRGQAVQVMECTPRGFNPPIRARAAFEYRPRWSVDRNLHFYRH